MLSPIKGYVIIKYLIDRGDVQELNRDSTIEKIVPHRVIYLNISKRNAYSVKHLFVSRHRFQATTDDV